MAATLSRLEAVNIVLAASDISPVSSIDVSTTLEARLAVNILDAVHREICIDGWSWNTEYEYNLEADDGTGEVAIPDSILRFDPREDQNLIHRGNRVYDRKNQTTVINEAVKGTATFYMEWEDLLEEVKTYITRRTARRFHEQHSGGSQSTLQSLVQDEREAKRTLLDGDTEQGSYSIFDHPDMHSGLNRGNPIAGRASFNSRDPFRTRLSDY